MSKEVTGTVYLLEEAKEYGSNGFRKRLMVLMQNLGRHENYIPLEFIADQCEDADDLKEGMEVTVEYRLKGRKWTPPEGDDKYFLSAEVVRIKCSDIDVLVQASSNEEEGGDEIPF